LATKEMKIKGAGLLPPLFIIWDVYPHSTVIYTIKSTDSYAKGIISSGH
jgi:hypothetical protein